MPSSSHHAPRPAPTAAIASGPRLSTLLAAGVCLSVLLPSAAPAASLAGTGGADVLTGTEGADTLKGGAGNDVLRGDPLAGTGPVTGVWRHHYDAIPGFADANSLYKPRLSPDGTRLTVVRAAYDLNNTLSHVANLFGLPADEPVLSPVKTLALEFFLKADDADAVGFGVPVASSGRFVFASVDDLVAADQNALSDVYVWNAAGGAKVLASVAFDGADGDKESIDPVLSPDGTKVAFASRASNLLAPGPDTNDKYDIFVRDLVANTTKRVSVSSTGAEADQSCFSPVFSPDGSKVAFTTSAATLVAGDTNGERDIYVHDLAKGTTVRVSNATGGVEALGGNAYHMAFSPDGRLVAFNSKATNLAPDDDDAIHDVFVHDTATGATTLVSRGIDGNPANADSDRPAFSPDGTKLFFHSYASNLVPGDTNNAGDLFMRDLAAGETVRISTAAGGAEAHGDTNPPDAVALAPDGRTVIYASRADDIVEGDANGLSDVFVATLPAAKGGGDKIEGGSGDDVIFGGPGDDTIDGGPGTDTLDGGPGRDTLSFASSATKVTASLAAATAGGDKISNFENLVGSRFGDTVGGTSGANAIAGGAGDDAISAGGGADRITGGRGRDRMKGGSGADRFVYLSAKDSPASAPDRISDFDAAKGDRIDLSAVDAAKGKKGRQAFRFIGGKPFSGRKGELRFRSGWLLGDTAGKGKATFAIRLAGVKTLRKSALIGVK